ncbi:nicotinate-nucleotide--dimethylbenzimidazole phosphoribosyltransferase [Streptomyces sp. NPDC046759]|uniref:nicotinate-nucleotide--dimethylbenzimidazole phosphoribosyltransferase n=1 Tax=Streptomyces sp. NPDC046759 TaxID=3155019 RepID=UPI0033F268ED
MTDTGQVPGEGQPESAGMVEQPGVPAHGAYTYLSEGPAEDEDLLLPGAQGAWGNEIAPPPPEPVVEAVHEPGPHETSGRDSGSVDLSGVRLPETAPASVPPSPILAAPQEQQAAAQPPRRPLHLGPPIPDTSASPVRSLADRGPAGAPVRQPAAPATGPEYLDAQPLRDMAPQSATPWGATPADVPAPAAVAQVGTRAPAAETVDPAAASADAVAAADPSGAAQAAVARLTNQTAAPAPGPAQVVHGHDGVQPVHAHDGLQHVHGHDGVHTAPAGEAPADVPSSVAGQPGEGAFEPAPAEGPASGRLPSVPGHGAEGVPQASADAGQDAPTAQSAEAAAAAGQVTEAGAPLPDAVAAPAGVAGTEAGDATGEQAALAQDPHTASVPGVPPTAPAEQVAVIVDEAEAHDVPGHPVPAPEPQDAQAAAGATEPVRPAEPAPAGAAPAPVDGAPAADAGRASTAAEAVVAADGAGTVPALQVPDTAQAAPEAMPPQAESAAPEQPAPNAPAPAPVAVAPQPGTEDARPDAADIRPGTSAAQPAPAAEAAQTPEVAPEAGALALAPEAAQTEAPAAQHAAAAPVATDGAATPEPHLYPAHGPQPAAVTAPTAEAEAGAPEAQAAVAPQAQPEPAPQDAVLPVAVAEAAAPDAAPAAPQPQPAEADAAPVTDGTPAPAATGAEPTTATPADGVPADPETGGPDAPAEQAEPLPSNVPQQAHPEQPLGQFVPVDGQVPTTPHLAPTPPQPLVLPPDEGQEPVATVPAPREGEQAAVPTPDVVQHAEDLQTRAADPEEESTAAVVEARQPTGPAAPGYADAEREAVLKVMRERRDIRNGFRSDPIPHEVLLRVLEAAHTAPSVGHSQPWDFVVIRSAETRRTMHELATRQREAYAKSLPKGRAKQFKELKIEAILDTPVNIVVTADPTRGGRHTLGRHTQPQMAPYSSALAVENLWLAARAEGLGVGWVSFFDEREMVRALGLPEHLEVVAYLCVGYVDEFPDEPELMQAGWSKRRPLSWVVHEETYGRRALPGEEPHDLLAETVAQIRPLDAKALGEAWERQKRMTKPAGALGMLEIISAQLSGLSRQCPPPIPEPAAVAIFAGDHGVHAQGVTPWPQEVTAQMVANFLGGGAVCNAFAGQVGAEVCVVDVGVAADLPATPGLLPRKIRGGTSDMTTGPAMTREEAKAAIEVGIETARDLVAAGNKALLTGEMGIANTTASAALISVFTGADPAEVTGRGTGINDETLARKTEVVRRALELHQPDPADPIGVLAAIGGFEHAAMVGLLLGGASLRTPVILDGVSAGAAALVARAVAPEVLAACIAGHRSAEPGHVAALNKLGLRPLVDLDLRLGEGTGALLALPLVQSTARAMHEVATFDSAGVTEK